MSRNLWQRLLWGGLAAVVFGLATLTPAPRAGAQETKVRLEVPSGEVNVGGASFPVDVLVEDVANLGAFEFTLSYDPSILEFVGVEKGPFLASSGRPVQCLDPRVTPGSVHFVCVTLGAMPPGAGGSGVLATFTFAPTGPGTSPLQLEQPILVAPSGQALPAASENASITVTAPGASTNWPLWGSVTGVAAVLVAGAAGVFWWSRVRKPS